MAEFLTMDEAKSKFGSKSRTNAGTAASNFNAVNTAINTVTGGCPSCTAQ